MLAFSPALSGTVPGLLDDPLVMVILGIVALIVWGLVFLVRRDGRQSTSHVKALGVYAKEHGYGYEPGVVEGLAEQLPDVSLGRSPVLSSVLSRTGAAPRFWAFNYRSFTGSAGGDTGSTRVTLAMFVMQSEVPVGRLALRPKGFIARRLGSFGAGDIESGQPEFDRAYHVTTATPEWGRRLLTAEICAELMRFKPRLIAISDGHVRVVKMGPMGVERLREDKLIAESLLASAAAPDVIAAAGDA